MCIRDRVYALSEDIDVPSISAAVESAFLNVLAGRAENDGFNRLIVGTGLGWREAAILRAYAHYMKQLRYNFSQQFVAETLGRHLGIARDLIELFRARFDPPPAAGRQPLLHNSRRRRRTQWSTSRWPPH